MNNEGSSPESEPQASIVSKRFSSLKTEIDENLNVLLNGEKTNNNPVNIDILTDDMSIPEGKIGEELSQRGIRAFGVDLKEPVKFNIIGDEDFVQVAFKATYGEGKLFLIRSYRGDDVEVDGDEINIRNPEARTVEFYQVANRPN